jgi:Ca-activated chloride channel family protein
LQQLAHNGRGAYYQATLQGGESEALLRDLSALTREEYETEEIRRFNPLYQYFLGPGLLLFLAAWFLPERRRIA